MKVSRMGWGTVQTSSHQTSWDVLLPHLLRCPFGLSALPEEAMVGLGLDPSGLHLICQTMGLGEHKGGLSPGTV